MHHGKLISASIIVLAGALQTIAASFCVQRVTAEVLLMSGVPLMITGLWVWLASLGTKAS